MNDTKTTPTVHDIAALMRTTPTPDASPQENAAWLQRKRDLLQRIEQRD